MVANKFIVEPTNENLERYKKLKDGKAYWQTADFFKYDPELEKILSEILDVYMDAMMNEEKDDDEDRVERRIAYSIAKMIVIKARKLNISSKDLRDRFDNFATVIWTPICVWNKDDFGKINYSLTSGLNGLK